MSRLQKLLQMNNSDAFLIEFGMSDQIRRVSKPTLKFVVLSVPATRVNALVARLKMLFPDMTYRDGRWYPTLPIIDAGWIVDTDICTVDERDVCSYDHIYYLKKFCVTHPEWPT